MIIGSWQAYLDPRQFSIAYLGDALLPQPSETLNSVASILSVRRYVSFP